MRMWMVALIIGIVVVFSAVVGFVLMQQDLNVPAPDGSTSQSPLLYIALFIGVAGIGYMLSMIYNNHTQGAHFSFWGFMNVALGALLVGGVIHELVHVILLHHPTQFRVHFGDAKAVFSTCCLAPGETPQEAIAYGVQFFIGLAWMWAFRNVFIQPALTSSEHAALHQTHLAIGSTPAPSHPHHSDAEDSMESEWAEEKRKMEEWLNPRPVVSEEERVREDEMNAEIQHLERLRTRPADKPQ